MVKHIVCFKLKNPAEKEKVRELLLSMRGNVPSAKKLRLESTFSARIALMM